MTTETTPKAKEISPSMPNQREHPRCKHCGKILTPNTTLNGECKCRVAERAKAAGAQ